jgi:hypothetical protein
VTSRDLHAVVTHYGLPVARVQICITVNLGQYVVGAEQPTLDVLTVGGEVNDIGERRG